MTREKIIEQLSTPPSSFGHLDLFLSNFEECKRNDVEQWMLDSIGSLYWKPNRRCIVFVGDYGKDLADNISFTYVTYSNKQQDLFFFLIVDNIEVLEKNEFKNLSDEIFSEGFSVTPGTSDNYPVVNKRLASYISYANKWNHNERREYVLVKCPNYSIQFDSLSFWKEVFFNYHNKK